MVALPETGKRIRELLEHYNLIYLTGAEMVSETHQSIKPFTASDPRIFKVADHTFYETGPYCEQLRHRYKVYAQLVIPGHQFKHFKWCKSEQSITKAWPDNWREIPHFQNLVERKQEGRRYARPE